VTLGGAYAVLAYFARRRSNLSRVQRAEMLDGLGMARDYAGTADHGVQFAGFMAAVCDPARCRDDVAGTLGGLLATGSHSRRFSDFLGATVSRDLARKKGTSLRRVTRSPPRWVGVILNLSILVRAGIRCYGRPHGAGRSGCRSTALSCRDRFSSAGLAVAAATAIFA